MSILRHIAEIDPAFCSDSNRRIAGSRRTAGYVPHSKSQAIVHRYNQPLRAATVFVWHVHNSTAAHFDMTMESATVHKGIHRVRQLISETAILAQGHCCVSYILRGIVDRMRILCERTSGGELCTGSRRYQQLCSSTQPVWSASNGLVIDTGGNAATLAHRIRFPVVIRKSGEASGAKQL